MHVGCDSVVAVLNAFRHQRNRTTRLQDVHAGSEQVLNAFRHQRNPHTLAIRGRPIAVDECSTPFGIKGIRTHRCPCAVSTRAVCSTPFGIKGIRTIAGC